MTSLRDVADHAGVSIATASRVATGSASVRAETRERVERAMRELLYVPRSRETATGAIGLLVPELGNPIFPALAEEMERRAAQEGLATILCNTAGSALREAEYVHMLLEHRVAGMIFISSEVTDLRSDHSHYARLLEEGAHLVFVNGGSERLDVTSVGVDERAAGRLATEHLLALGHTRIGFAAGEEHASPTREKAEGRVAALAAAGHRPEGARRLHGVRRGRRAAGVPPADGLERLLPDGDHLLERPDGDRRHPGGGCARHPRAGRPLGGGLRRHRRPPTGRSPCSRPSSSRSTRSRRRPSRRSAR